MARATSARNAPKAPSRKAPSRKATARKTTARKTTARKTTEAKDAASAKAREAEVLRLEREVFQAKRRLAAARQRKAPEPVEDYEFRAASGKPVRLSQLFGTKDDLVVVHNMGTKCPMCTTWADGFDGVAHHLEDRAAFVVSSPDPVPVQKAFAKKRGWRFRMVSAAGTSFFPDMGFASPDGQPWPGISTFRREADGRIVRVAHTAFGPGDDFSPVFGVLPLLQGGQGEWWPKFKYPKGRRE